MPVQVSVIVPTYNRWHILKETLNSLSNQTQPREDYEVVVVDDGSTDGTGEMLTRVRFDLPLKTVRHGRNRGRAAARNSGIRSASGEFIMFLDDDMTSAPGLIAAHLRAHEQSKNCAVIGNIRFGLGIKRDALTRYLSVRGVHRLRPGEKVPLKCFVTGNSSVRKKHLQEADLFDETFTAYGGEDLDLGCRLHRIGLDFIYCPEAVSYHDHLRRFDEICALMRTYGARSVPILLRKHPHLIDVLQLHLSSPLDLSRDSIPLIGKKLLFKLAMNSTCYGVLKGIVSILREVYVPSLAFDYIWMYNRWKGYREFLSNCD